MWLLPMQHQHEVTQPRLRLIANCPTTRMRSQIGVTTAFTVVPLFGQRMGDHARPSLEHCSMQQTSLPAATVNKCRRNHFNADGNAKFTELSPESHDTSSAAAPFSTGRNGSSRASLMELCIVGVMSLLSVDLETTITQTQRLTQPYQTTMTTSPPSPVNRQRPCSHRAPSCSRLPGAGLLSFLSDVSG